LSTTSIDAPELRGRSLVLSLLLLAYTFSFIDRTIVAIIGQAIKADLKLTDTQLGLLGGLSFAILYTVMGIPLARIAERWNRVSLISISMLVWSAFTVACGYAQTFVQLLLYRVGVGVGEAGCSPPAHSLISDYFEPRRRGTALAIYALGVPLGSMFGAVAGGWIAQNLSWRLAFILVGLPGIAVAILIKLLMKNPPVSEARRAMPPFSMREESRQLGAVARHLFARWPVAHMVLGLTASSFATYGWGQFAPPYFIRTFGLDFAQVGLITGIIVGLSAGLGTLLGGIVGDWAARRDARWYALVPGIGSLLAAPLYIWAFLQPSWQGTALILLLPGVFAYAVLGPTYAVVQNTVGPTQRATATALLLFFINFIALGFGPPTVGWLIDRFAEFNFARPALHDALSSFGAWSAGLPGTGESFAALCPGGVHPSDAGLDVRCKASLALGTRQGILLSFLLYAWAGAHYLAATWGLRKLMRDAA
jgi:MFS family permease